MEAQKTAHEYRMHHWIEKIRQCRNSGMTIKAFCQSQDLNIKSYYYWQRQIREAANKELVEAQNSDSENRIIPDGWAQLSKPKFTEDQPSLTIEISGFHIAANKTTDFELLAKVCRMLRSL